MKGLKNINVKLGNEELELLNRETGNMLLEFCYPVGSIYTTVDDSFNPDVFFGGTWKRLEGKYLRARKTTESKSETAVGQDSFTVSNSNIVAFNVTSGTESKGHTHNVKGSTGTETAHESFSWSGSHKHNDKGHTHSQRAPTTDKGKSSGDNTSKVRDYENISTGTGYADIEETSITVSGTCTGDHTHSMDFTSGGVSANHTHTSTIGSSTPTAIDNRPASILVNMWIRTA